MEKLEKIFEARDMAFEKQTHEIFDIIHTTLVCVTTFLSDIDPVFEAGTIMWEDVNLVDGGIVIIGMVDYTEGTEMEVDNNTVIVTKDNIEYFRRIIHMSLPLDLVYEDNEDVIMEFLYNMHSQDNVSTFSEPLVPAVNNNPDFDLTKLTEQQRQSLMFHNNKEKN